MSAASVGALLDHDVVVVDFSPGARLARDPRDKRLEDDDPDTVRRRLRSSRVVPGAIEGVGCPAHDAAVGEPCYRVPVAICGERLARSLLAAVPAELVEPGEDWLHRRAERDRLAADVRRASRRG